MIQTVRLANYNIKDAAHIASKEDIIVVLTAVMTVGVVADIIRDATATTGNTAARKPAVIAVRGSSGSIIIAMVAVLSATFAFIIKAI